MAIGWYYKRHGTSHGPVTSRELSDLARSGGLDPSDLVRRDGMAEWVPSRQVKGLFSVAVDHTAPTLPSMAPPTSPTALPSDPTVPDDEHLTDMVSQLVSRTRAFLERVYDTTSPTDGLDTELEELRRLTLRHQDYLTRAAEQNAKERRASKQRVESLGEAVRLLRQARAAREAGRTTDADQLTAEADRMRAGVPRLTRDEQDTLLARLRRQVDLFRELGRILAEAQHLLGQAVDGIANRRLIEDRTRSGVPAAVPPTGVDHPKAAFAAWYGRAFAAVVALPPVVAWPLQVALWTVGFGILWIPVLYSAGKSRSCPSCGRLWVRAVEGERLLGREQGFAHVERKDEHYDAKGDYAGKTYRTEQVAVNHDTVQVHYSCSGCGNRWSEQQQRTTEA